MAGTCHPPLIRKKIRVPGTPYTVQDSIDNIYIYICTCMHIYIIFTRFKLCAGAFKRVRNRHVTWIGTNMADQRKRYIYRLESSFIFGFSILAPSFHVSSKRKLMRNRGTFLLEENTVTEYCLIFVQLSYNFIYLFFPRENCEEILSIIAKFTRSD